MSEGFPQGWTVSTVSVAIEDLQAGFASGEKSVKDGVAQLRMNNIGLDGDLVLDLVRTVPTDLAKPQHELRRGDVIVCTTNSGKLVGKCAYFDLVGRFVFSNHLTRLRPKSNCVDGKFLRWALWLHWREGRFDDLCKHWVNQSALPKDALLEAEIPLPPLAEQQRIVAKLEVLLGKVDACRKRLEKIPVILKRFRQSVLAAACSGRLTEDWREENTDVESAGGLVTRISSERHERYEKLSRSHGGRKKALNDYDNYEPTLREDLDLPDLPHTWRWVDLRFLMSPDEAFCYGVVQPGADDPQGPRLVRVCDLEGGGVQLPGLRGITNEVQAQYDRSVVSGGEVLVSVVGTIGRASIAPVELKGANIARAVAKIPIREFAARFYLLWLSSSRAEALMVGDSREVARKTLNLEQLRTLPAPLPPLPEQHEIVRRVEALFALADQIEARYAKAKTHVDRLTQSILSKAFRGELVPQDPKDEPASVLLERIRAQEARDGVPRKRSGRGGQGLGARGKR